MKKSILATSIALSLAAGSAFGLGLTTAPTVGVGGVVDVTGGTVEIVGSASGDIPVTVMQVDGATPADGWLVGVDAGTIALSDGQVCSLLAARTEGMNFTPTGLTNATQDDAAGDFNGGNQIAETDLIVAHYKYTSVDVSAAVTTETAGVTRVAGTGTVLVEGVDADGKAANFDDTKLGSNIVTTFSAEAAGFEVEAPGGLHNAGDLSNVLKVTYTATCN